MELNQFGEKNLKQRYIFWFLTHFQFSISTPPWQLQETRTVQKWEIRAKGGKFGRVLLGVRIKFPIGKIYECHISAISDQECTVKIGANFFINCFVNLRLN